MNHSVTTPSTNDAKMSPKGYDDILLLISLVGHIVLNACFGIVSHGSFSTTYPIIPYFAPIFLYVAVMLTCMIKAKGKVGFSKVKNLFTFLVLLSYVSGQPILH